MRAVYFYLMREDPERVRSAVPQHAAYWHTGDLQGYLGGPFADRSGGLIIFESETAEDAARLVASDPFVIEGLVESSWLKEWRPE